MITASLPPHITPTLPTSIQLPPWITPTLPPPAQPAPGTTEQTTPSGLVVVRNQLTPVTRGSQLVVATKPLAGDAALEAAKAAHAELAAAQGGAVADIVHGGQVELAQGIRNDELRREAVEALMAGDLSRAADLISQQG